MNSIIIVDDHRLFAEGMRQILKNSKVINVIGMYESTEELFRHMTEHRPRMVVLDIQMPRDSGIEACKKIKSVYPYRLVVFVSMFSDAENLLACKAAGADGYIHKSTDAPTMVNALLKIMKGEKVYILPSPPETTENTENETENPFRLLTPREREILKLIKTGKKTREIADMLNLSEYTIETHRKNISAKTGCKSHAELIYLANLWSI